MLLSTRSRWPQVAIKFHFRPISAHLTSISACLSCHQLENSACAFSSLPPGEGSTEVGPVNYCVGPHQPRGPASSRAKFATPRWAPTKREAADPAGKRLFWWAHGVAVGLSAHVPDLGAVGAAQRGPRGLVSSRLGKGGEEPTRSNSTWYRRGKAA